VPRRIVLATLMVAGCSAFDKVQAPPQPSKLSLAIAATGLKTAALSFGDTTRVSYVFRDVFGNPTVSSRPAFVSRNTFVATISTFGLIRATGPGSTYVVAFATGQNNETISDSVSVTVTQVCTLEARAGIVITLEDSVSGSRGPFAGVSYVARDGAYRDTLFLNSVAPPAGQPTFQVGLAYERAGTYQVTVTASGYKPWTKSAVAVAKDACHVIPVSLTARLVRP